MTYPLISLQFIDLIRVNCNKCQDPMRLSPKFLCLKSSTPTVNGPSIYKSLILFKHSTLRHMFYANCITI